jgi:iron complex transport system substrate-binding protein
MADCSRARAPRHDAALSSRGTARHGAGIGASLRPAGMVASVRRIGGSLRHAAWILCLLCASAGAEPSVASINLCTDQLVLSLADPEQIRTVSWLAADPAESMLASEAARYPLNYGSAEEVLRFRPDVVIGGAYTNDFTRRLLGGLGFTVITVEPAESLADIERNVLLVAGAVGQTERGETLVRNLRRRAASLASTRPAHSVATVVVRPGGFTVGAGSLADELITLAGLSNVAAEQGLDRWGSLSMETLLEARPSMLLFTSYRPGEPSLANAILEHPAMTRAGASLQSLSVDSSYFACGLPRSLDVVDVIRRAIEHRDARRESR